MAGQEAAAGSGNPDGSPTTVWAEQKYAEIRRLQQALNDPNISDSMRHDTNGRITALRLMVSEHLNHGGQPIYF